MNRFRFLFLGIILLASCSQRPLPEQVSGTLGHTVNPDWEELRKKKEIHQKKREKWEARQNKRMRTEAGGSSITGRELLAFGAGAGFTHAAHKMFPKRDYRRPKGCDACGSDGYIHRGDIAHRDFRVKVGEVCPKCKGRPFH